MLIIRCLFGIYRVAVLIRTQAKEFLRPLKLFMLAFGGCVFQLHAGVVHQFVGQGAG